MDDSTNQQPLGLKALAGKEIIGLRDFALATGLKLSTIRQYKKYAGHLPEEDDRNRWFATRSDVQEWIIQKLEKQGWIVNAKGHVTGRNLDHPRAKTPRPARNPFAV